ncbi:unnamed protein product [Danaus chrysippus]|uniref:(African queen) hypothetical protein n=1 Tax=Danaus chrysippus TaxID=151541 RepID=A0A8J2QW01_9NEOP|nr:unnamed protein product [Danaus chrysippus]
MPSSPGAVFFLLIFSTAVWSSAGVTSGTPSSAVPSWRGINYHTYTAIYIWVKMWRATVIVCFILIVSALCINLSCNSCGIECAPACGTRRFRSCCFNYLRKKREDHEFTYNIEQSKIPVFLIDNPETASNVATNDFKAF